MSSPSIPLQFRTQYIPSHLIPVLTTHYSLLTTRYSLLTTRYSLLITHCCSLLTTHCSLLTTHYSLLTTHYSLLTTHYSLLTTLLTTHHSLLAAHYSPLATHFSLLATEVGTAAQAAWRTFEDECQRDGDHLRMYYKNYSTTTELRYSMEGGKHFDPKSGAWRGIVYTPEQASAKV